MSQLLKRRNGGRKPRRSTGVQIAINLPKEQVAAAERAVNEGRARSVSAYVADALERQTRADALGELIASMRAEGGTPSSQDYAWADAALGVSRRSQSRATR
jgi:antitoxin ParD1/3/4